MLHRVIYYFHNQEWDIYHSYLDNSIDHINENKTDNRIENLRVVNNSQNSQKWTFQRISIVFLKGLFSI